MSKHSLEQTDYAKLIFAYESNANKTNKRLFYKSLLENNRNDELKKILSQVTQRYLEDDSLYLQALYKGGEIGQYQSEIKQIVLKLKKNQVWSAAKLLLNDMGDKLLDDQDFFHFFILSCDALENYDDINKVLPVLSLKKIAQIAKFLSNKVHGHDSYILYLELQDRLGLLTKKQKLEQIILNFEDKEKIHRIIESYKPKENINIKIVKVKDEKNEDQDLTSERVFERREYDNFNLADYEKTKSEHEYIDLIRKKAKPFMEFEDNKLQHLLDSRMYLASTEYIRKYNVVDKKLYLYCESLLRAQLYGELIITYNQKIHIHEEKVEFVYLKALAYKALGHKKKAIELFEYILSVNPNYRQVGEHIK